MKLVLYCNKCFSPVNYSNGLFTSCGHILCINCTNLRGNDQGECNYCQMICNVISLDVKSIINKFSQDYLTK